MVPCEETSVHSSVDTRNSGTSSHLGILCNLRNPRVWDNSKLHPSLLSSPTHLHDYYYPLPPLPTPPPPYITTTITISSSSSYSFPFLSSFPLLHLRCLTRYFVTFHRLPSTIISFHCGTWDQILPQILHTNPWNDPWKQHQIDPTTPHLLLSPPFFSLSLSLSLSFQS